MEAYSKTISIFFVFLLLFGCKKDITQNVVYDNVIYEINPVEVYESNADKTRQKTSEQFISILYTDLFNEPISSDGLNDFSEVMLSFGDKGLMNTMALENMLNSFEVDIPSSDEMRNDIDKFIDETYLRFYLRYPSEYEKKYFHDLIEGDAGITPELVYAAFAQSNEYLFY